MLKKYCLSVLLVLIILFTGILLIRNKYNDTVIENEMINNYIEDTTMDSSTTIKRTASKTTVRTSIKRFLTTTKANYNMVLYIPKINIKKGIYDKNDKNNNVDKNIAILSSSSMPDEDKGNVILASHNGNTRVSYFKNLEKLNINDFAYIYYKGIKYTYSIYKSDIVDKTGTIKINKDSNASNLVLISCKNGTTDKQIVYVARQINKESY